MLGGLPFEAQPTLIERWEKSGYGKQDEYPAPLHPGVPTDAPRASATAPKAKAE